MDASKLCNEYGIEIDGDPTACLRAWMDRMAKVSSEMPACLDDFGAKCAFGKRCTRCESKPYNCVTILKDMLEGK